MAAGKNTGLQIGLIICMVLMVIFGVVAYLMYKDYTEAAAERDTAKDQFTKADNARKNYLEQITVLKGLIGAQFDNVGQAGSQDPNTVIGFANQKMNELAGPGAQTTLVDAMQRLRAELNARERDLATLQTNENKINDEKMKLQTVYNDKAEQYNDNYKKAQDDLNAQVTEKDETVKGITKQLDEERAKYTEIQISFESLQEESNKKIDDLNNQIEKLTKTNDELVKEISNLRDMSFDVPDGYIVSVNYDTNSVFINLGKADKLQPGTTFSVYQKNLSTVGGKTSEIKASIEVIKIIDEHTSEAKITSEGDYMGDYARPIARGDAVYSPLWRAGIQEVFALDGKFDLDGDKTDDRYILINMIRAAGGEVGAQVTPDGERTGGEITSQFKFLVLGDIGDPSQEPDERQRALIQKVHSHTNDLKKEAQQSGVRVITMNDFLSYMGYKPQRRLWRPGENIPWVMTTKRDAGRSRKDIESTGTVSGAYSRSNRNVNSPR